MLSRCPFAHREGRHHGGSGDDRSLTVHAPLPERIREPTQSRHPPKTRLKTVL
jgi:hypothetical protein